MGIFNSGGNKDNNSLLNSLYEELRQKSNTIIELQKENAESKISLEKLSAQYSKANETITKLQSELDNAKNISSKRSRESSFVSETTATSSNNDSLILTAGKYRGGIDIPLGTYNLIVLSGEGHFETNKPEDVYENISCNPNHGFGFLNEYRNLEISDKTILKIHSSAKVRFELCKKFDYAKEFLEEKKLYATEFEKEKNVLDSQKRIIELEISSIKNELKSLNDECIKTYYKFSSYDKITSSDCKNKLTVLKQEENELRSSEKDVIIQKRDYRTPKLEERIVRQLLRTFNCECDNVMLNVSLKNIDRSRRLVQASFDTLNKLYSIDGIFLTKELLKIKLEQVTLMYTYELKYQQEKDIQRAIKEQMLEEAKAEREIEEAKKKIEKDLQQYTGEVNRLMKYVQKIQLDVEKQMYMDKIKELEDKIKTLQSDKETVLEREANAKAGFVYIISNIGSFGENVYKIGMTRRLEPMDRIRELSSASVPFEFDVHAMIFSDDAPSVETMLHKHFEKYAVNKINPRKEFYKIDIDEIEQVVLSEYNNTVKFTKIPLATEYRQSMALLEN